MEIKPNDSLSKEEIKEIADFTHKLAEKDGRKLLMVKNATVPVEENFIKLENYLMVLSEHGLLHDKPFNTKGKPKFYTCINDNIMVHPLNAKYSFLERHINTNNRNKGIYTELILKSFIKNPNSYFVEFLKVLTSTYKKNGNDKELVRLYWKYIPYFKDMISDENDLKWLSIYENQLRLYHLLARGGTVYQKGNSIDCIFSLFYTQEKIDEDDIPSILSGRNIDDVFIEDVAYREINLSNDTIDKLIVTGYLNEKILYAEIKFLKKRSFYIPKKKRKKRVYTEDKEYIIYRVKDLCIKDTVYTKGSYNRSVPKVHIDKKSRKKRYIPYTKDDWVDTYQVNKKKDKMFMIDCLTRIINSNR